MQRWFSGENWVQKMPVFLPAHRVAHQPTRSRIFTYTFKSILIFAEKGWFDAVIYFISLWHFFSRFTKRVIPAKILSSNHVTPDRKLHITSARMGDITIRKNRIGSMFYYI